MLRVAGKKGIGLKAQGVGVKHRVEGRGYKVKSIGAVVIFRFPHPRLPKSSFSHPSSDKSCGLGAVETGGGRMSN